jgi:DNA-binding MarR family transcriptional regulator
LLTHREATDPGRRHHPTSGTPFESLAVSIRRLRQLIADQLNHDQLAVTDFRALAVIADGVTSPTALGRVLAVTPAGMTQLLDRLEEPGLIARSRNPDDRRATVVSLTPKGRELERRAGARISRLLDAVASELTPAGLAGLQVLSRELDSIVARRIAALASAE